MKDMIFTQRSEFNSALSSVLPSKNKWRVVNLGTQEYWIQNYDCLLLGRRYRKLILKGDSAFLDHIPSLILTTVRSSAFATPRLLGYSLCCQ